MSLRTRLTILYTALVGGILLLFGVATYQVISRTLVERVDRKLIDAYQVVIEIYRQDPMNRSGLTNLTSLEPSSNVLIQFWARNGQLVDAWPQTISAGRALDPVYVQSASVTFRSLYHQSVHMRVLTVPLKTGDHILGSLQIGTNLEIVDVTQQELLKVMLIGLIAAMGLAAVAGWYSTQQVLIPLRAVTETALQITRADDLSRRIPGYGLSQKDEIGQLIAAFNQTLGRLEHLFSTQRRFLTDVGHELRTPLTVIKGNVDLMKKMGCGDVESLDSIRDEADRMVRLSGDLLLLSQAETGKLPMVVQPTELDTLLLQVLQDMTVLAHGQVKVHLGEFDQVMVCGDRDRLKQVLVNLAGNAVRYTPAGGDVVLSLIKTDTEACVSISDTGPGIAEEDLSHIFERFYRAEKARTRSKDGQGFGLGLSIAYWIVRNHNGRIEVESELGKGTTFRVWLPLAESECSKEIMV